MTSSPAAAAAAHRIPIFRAGTHVSADGTRMEFSDATLAACVAAYDPALHESPLTVGHPKDNLPAYGWVKGLAFEGGTLYAEADQVDPAFAELVNAGRFKKRSAAFYLPTSPGNPVPGTLYLRHVAFLGAQPPAIKGLRDVQFSAGDEGVIEFGDWSDQQVASLFGRMREWVISKFGLDEADKALPSYLVESVTREALTPEPIEAASMLLPGAPIPLPSISYSETGADPVSTPTPESLAAQAAALSAQRADLDARQARLDATEAAARQATRLAEFREFTGGLVQAGQLLPVQQERLVAVMAALPEAQVVEFAEGTTAVKDRPAVQALQEFLKSLPKQVDFSERARDDANSKPGLDVNDSMAIARAAAEFQEAEGKAGRTVRIEDAVSYVVQQAESAGRA